MRAVYSGTTSYRTFVPILLGAFLFYHSAIGQDTLSGPLPVNTNIAAKAVGAIDKKFASIRRLLQKKSLAALNRFRRQEHILKDKIGSKDTVLAARLFASVEVQYDALQQSLTDSVSITSTSPDGYVPRIDSLKTLLKFMDAPGATPGSGVAVQKIQSAFFAITGAQQQLQATNAINDFIKQRKARLQAAFEKCGMAKELAALKKQAFYYQQQVSEYKQLLSDPDKLADRLLSAVRGTRAFKDFMSRNSMLSQLFPAANGANLQSLQGLQTRSSIQQQLALRMGVAGGSQQYLQQQTAAAQAQLDILKEKVNKAGGGSSDLDMPDFKPNNQKTKSFWKRIEYGLNIQSQRPNGLLPVTSDIALTAGYKLNDKSVVGIGASYKMGWGKNLSNIRITSEGVSLRSYLDVKLKGGLWISGGYEKNYQQSFAGIDQLKNLSAWQSSGLIGLTKKYKIGKKTGNLQLLWDFLSYDQVPKTPALKFRTGIVF